MSRFFKKSTESVERAVQDVWLRKFIDKDLGHFPIAVGLLGRRIAQIGDIQEVRQQVRLLACNRFN